MGGGGREGGGTDRSWRGLPPPRRRGPLPKAEQLKVQHSGTGRRWPAAERRAMSRAARDGRRWRGLTGTRRTDTDRAAAPGCALFPGGTHRPTPTRLIQAAGRGA